MSTQPDDSNDYDLPQYKKDQIQKIDAERERRQKWRKEIAENHELQEYFKAFHPKSVAAFIEHLLGQKNVWVENSTYYQDQISNEGIEWLEPAHEHLKVIQQKKLFDKQCLWRAEKIKIEGVQLCCEFMLWENDVLNCPFIYPVNEEDITGYISFLKQYGSAEIDVYEGWQNYEKIKTAFEDWKQAENLPAWYNYNDGISDAGMLITLPDIRGEKEAFYKRITAEAMQVAKKEKGETDEPGMPQIINYWDQSFMKSFVEKFESKEMKRLFKGHDWWLNQNKKEDLIYSDLEVLFKAGEVLSIKANDNWMAAVKETANWYRLKKIIEALPEACEHYTLNMQTGISFSFDKTLADKYEAIKNLHAKQVIAGRLVNDEPGDLNF